MSPTPEQVSYLQQKLKQLKVNMEYRLKVNDDNKTKRHELLNKRREKMGYKEIVDECLAYVERNEERVRLFIDEKKKKSLQAVNTAIFSASTVVNPSYPVRLNITEDKAMLETKEDQVLKKREGSGFRAVLGFFMRPTILDNSNYINFVMFDEAVATLSAENTALLSQRLPILGKYNQIALIEQKSEIFAGVDAKIYEVSNTDGKSKIVNTRS